MDIPTNKHQTRPGMLYSGTTGTGTSKATSCTRSPAEPGRRWPTMALLSNVYCWRTTTMPSAGRTHCARRISGPSRWPRIEAAPATERSCTGPTGLRARARSAISSITFGSNLIRQATCRTSGRGGGAAARGRNAASCAKRLAADQASSSVGNSTSWVSSCSAAATGIATSAPTIPNSAAPIRTATIVTPAGTLTARPITLGTSR